MCGSALVWHTHLYAAVLAAERSGRQTGWKRFNGPAISLEVIRTVLSDKLPE